MAEDVGQTKPGWRTGSFDWTVGKQPLPPGTAPSVPRRSFLGALLAVGGAATAAALAVPIIRFVLYPLRNTTTEVQWSDIGPASDFASLTAPMRTLITVEQVDGWRKIILQRPVYVVKAAAGAITVLSAVCPHLGCAVRYTDADQKFVCPCHNGTFDSSVTLVSGPPPRNLDTLESKTEDGVLKVRYQFFRQLTRNKEVIG